MRRPERIKVEGTQWLWSSQLRNSENQADNGSFSGFSISTSNICGSPIVGERQLPADNRGTVINLPGGGQIYNLFPKSSAATAACRSAACRGRSTRRQSVRARSGR